MAFAPLGAEKTAQLQVPLAGQRRRLYTEPTLQFKEDRPWTKCRFRQR